jgi:VanZ family protein
MINYDFNKPLLLKVLFVLSVTFASFLFLKQGGHSGVNFQHADKVGHFLIFFSLALLLDFSFKFSVIKSLIILSIYGVLIEVMQSFLPYREASAGDILADVLGVVIYLVLFRKLIQSKFNKPE